MVFSRYVYLARSSSFSVVAAAYRSPASLLSCFRADPSIRLPIDRSRRKLSLSSITLGPTSEIAPKLASLSHTISLREVCRRLGRRSEPPLPTQAVPKPAPEAIPSPDFQIEGWSKTFMRQQRPEWAPSPVRLALLL